MIQFDGSCKGCSAVGGALLYGDVMFLCFLLPLEAPVYIKEVNIA